MDRYVQTLVLAAHSAAKQRETAVLTSVEGDSHQIWPASPPLQDLNFHGLPDGRTAALAVGRAGKSHWSLAWEASRDQPLLVCDVACRVKETPGYLASTWTMADHLSVTQTGGLRIKVDNAIVLVDIEDQQFATKCEQVGRKVCLLPDSIEFDLPTTVRWRYRISIVDA
jgi:hypothetical protein